MKTVILAFRFLKKQLLINILLIITILLSIILLAELFVYISDHFDNIRAAKEMNNQHTYVMDLFNYYYGEEEKIVQEISDSPGVDGVGRAFMNSCLINSKYVNCALYSNELIMHYSPALRSGTWFTNGIEETDSDAIPAVISSDIGLGVGDIADIRFEESDLYTIRVIGLLDNPTQYLYPLGASDSVSSFISHTPVVILQEKDISNKSMIMQSPEDELTRVLFIYASVENADLQTEHWSKYGTVTRIEALVNQFMHDSYNMIHSGAISFFVFFALASMILLSSNVMQSIVCKRYYTIYYLLGMKWQKIIEIEVLRIAILGLVTFMLVVLCGKYGVLMFEWMTTPRMVAFYIVTTCYIVLMFSGVSAFFIFKLRREDIASALKGLSNGE